MKKKKDIIVKFRRKDVDAWLKEIDRQEMMSPIFEAGAWALAACRQIVEAEKED